MKYNAIYGQSGGPTSVINASMYGFIKQCLKEKDIDNIYIMHNGINGLINDDIKSIKDIPLSEIEHLPFTPSALAGSLRYKLPLPSKTEDIYQKILLTLKKYNINMLFINGGNDSMDTCYKLSTFFKLVSYDCRVIGIPKTIDNDLVCTDHTPGYASAAKFVITAIQSIYYDNLSYPHGRVNIVEIMGRDSGWLTAASSLANITGCGPDLIYVPEKPFDIDVFLNDVKQIYSKKKRVLVAVSEGIKDSLGNLVFTQKTNDVFNHQQLGGVASHLSFLIEQNLDISTRAIELSLLQRCYSYSASKVDIKEAINCGRKAVIFALKNQSGVMVTIKRVSSSPYKVKYETISLEKIANYTQNLPDIYINKKGNNINDNFIEYCLPLVSKDDLLIFAKKDYF